MLPDLSGLAVQSVSQVCILEEEEEETVGIGEFAGLTEEVDWMADLDACLEEGAEEETEAFHSFRRFPRA